MNTKMKKNPLKVVIIGAGSSYTPELIEGMLARKNEMTISELWLVDIDDGWHKAMTIKSLTERMVKHAGVDMKIHLTKDRQQALKNADFICSQFRVGCLEGRIRDETISLKHGMIGQETNGLGGFANACRTIPVALEICREIEQLCPKAWLLNFTNPSGMVTEAILKQTNVNVVGLCNVPVTMQKGAAKIIGCNEDELVMQIAGLNHLVWATEIIHDGENKLPQVLDAVLAGDNSMVPQNIPAFGWPTKLVRDIGLIPCAYLRYYYQSQDMLDDEVIEMKEHKLGCRAEVVKDIERKLFEIYENPQLNVKPKELELRGGQYYSEAACELMSAIHNDKRTIMHVNTRNNGAIAGLPDDCAVEVSSIITSAGPKPLNVAPLPVDVLRLIQLMKEFETLTVKAAIDGDFSAALRALVLNPIVPTGKILEKALEETIMANSRYMPQFSSLIEELKKNN